MVARSVSASSSLRLPFASVACGAVRSRATTVYSRLGLDSFVVASFLRRPSRPFVVVVVVVVAFAALVVLDPGGSH